MKSTQFLTLIFCLISHATSGQNLSDTLHYSVVINGFVIGDHQYWKTSDSTFNYTYQYSERGRGDSLTASVIVDNNYLVKSGVCSGTDYYHQKYHQELFRRNDSLISVVNGFSEYISKSTDQYYLFYIPATWEFLYRSVIKSTDRKIAFGYRDTLYLNSITEHEIGINENKFSIKLAEFFIGTGLPPEFIWLDENDNYFGDVSNYGWRNHIRSGFESWVDSLVNWQEKRSQIYFKKEFDLLSEPLKQKIAIKSVRLFNAKNATTSENKTVLIENGYIKEIGNSSELVIPEDYEIISGAGKTMMPGLWDMHAHYTSDAGPLYITGGITHVRDMGNTPSILIWQKAIRDHKMVGPDISFTSGFIDRISPLQGPIGKIVPTLEAAINAEIESKKEGYDHIKLYGSISPEWVKPLCDSAHGLGFRVGGHVPSGMNVFDVANAGYDDISHMISLMNSLLSDSLSRAKGKMAHYPTLAQNLNINGNEVMALINKLKEEEVTIDPTLSFYFSMFCEFSGDTIEAYKAVFDWIPKVYHNALIVSTPKVDENLKEEYKLFYAKMLELLKLAFENNIRIVAGTDGLEQLAMQRELELYVKAGIPAADVLKIATYNGALNCGLESQFGTIEEGRVADFILIDGTPDINISDIRKVFLVVTNNTVYYPKELYKNGGWTYYY